MYITYPVNYLTHIVYYMIHTISCKNHVYYINHKSDAIVVLYLGFAIATPGAVWVLLNKSFKSTKRVLKFSL